MTPGAGKRCDPDGASARGEQRFSCSAGRGAGGENVIDEKYVFTGDNFGLRDAKGATKIDPALARSESSLAFSCPLAHQGLRRESQSPGGVRVFQQSDSFGSQQTRLIEAATAEFRVVQRNGNDEQF